MAIYHLSMKIINRSSGRSSVAASAYRSAEKIRNEKDNIIHDYSRKKNVVYKNILLPENVDKKFESREHLWNEVEKVEKRKDAQTAKELEIALPHELELKEQIELIETYIKENLTSQGMIADLCIHDKKSKNVHAHILLTTRKIESNKFTKKEREWNKKEFLLKLREEWALKCNEKLKKHNVKISEKTLKKQGEKYKLAQIHIGRSATNLHRRGKYSYRYERNKQIKERNKLHEIEMLKSELKQLENRYIDIDKQIIASSNNYNTLYNELKRQIYSLNDLQNIKYSLDNFNSKISDLRTVEGNLNFFKRKQKFEIKKQIEQIEISKQQAETILQNKYNTTYNKINEKVKEIENLKERLEDNQKQYEYISKMKVKSKIEIEKEYKQKKYIYEEKSNKKYITEIKQNIYDEIAIQKLNKIISDEQKNKSKNNIHELEK